MALLVGVAAFAVAGPSVAAALPLAFLVLTGILLHSLLEAVEGAVPPDLGLLVLDGVFLPIVVLGLAEVPSASGPAFTVGVAAFSVYLLVLAGRAWGSRSAET